MTCLDYIMELHWTTIVVVLMELNMVLLMGHILGFRLDKRMRLCLILIKASNLALLMLKFFVLYLKLIMYINLGLMKELRFVLYDG